MRDSKRLELAEWQRQADDAIEGARHGIPSTEAALGVVAVRWQMVHARELRQIRESLARLEAALADAQATGAEK